MQSASDQELIVELKKGSLDALGILYDRHRRMVYRTALGIVGDPDSAADLLQDTFLRLHRFADRIDCQRALEPWLYRVTTNLAYTWVKRRKRWFSPIEDIAEWLSGNKKQTPQFAAEMDEESQQVQQAITALPIAQRVVVVLYYINDLSLQEISEILEVPEGTVKSRLHYSRQSLKKHLRIQEDKLPDMQYEFT
ncbi:MAG TPA: RNA polymerase sigma factor [Anaerolineales bacterium]|jgi:RNA polymerase sigma-70 factor (ECF subfamily)